MKPAHAQSDSDLTPAAIADPDVFDIREWVLRNIQLNDPVELCRNELRSWAEAAGFENIDVRNLGDLAGWELRLNRGTNTECTTAAEAERWDQNGDPLNDSAVVDDIKRYLMGQQYILRFQSPCT